jgi:hypothetical protein
MKVHGKVNELLHIFLISLLEADDSELQLHTRDIANPWCNFLITKMYAALKPQGGCEVVKERQISTPARV